jgi:hypothetical protein
VLIDLDGVRLLTDPVLRSRVAHLRRRERVDPALYTNIDAVLVSHLHFDHLDPPSLEQLSHGTQLVVPRGGGGLLMQRGFRRVAEVEAGEEVQIGALTVHPTYAEHKGTRLPFFGASAPTLGNTITGNRKIYLQGIQTFSTAWQRSGVASTLRWFPSGDGDRPLAAATSTRAARPRRSGSCGRSSPFRSTGAPTPRSASDVCRPLYSLTQ